MLSRLSACRRQRLHILTTTKRLEECFVLDKCNASCRHKTSHSQLDDKSVTGTPILHAEASFISAERGLHQEFLSRTSLKCHICFGFILKLMIFICKQLKRPVAFSAVQFTVSLACIWFAKVLLAIVNQTLLRTLCVTRKC